MATTTTNYGLTKPEGSDFYDIGVQNDNMDIIDNQMKANAKDIAQLNSDKENKSNKIFKNNGQSNDITIEFENIAEVSKKCDKFPVLFWGTANGNPVFAQFLISLENLHISQVITSNVTNSITASIDWYSLTVHGLSHYGFFVFEAPPGVKIKQNGIDI